MLKKLKNIAQRFRAVNNDCDYSENDVISDISSLIADTYELSERDVRFGLERYFENYPLFINNGNILKKLKEAANYALYRNGLEPAFKIKGAPFSSVYTGYWSRPSVANVVREFNLSAIL